MKINSMSDWDARLERASAYSLYLHVPFCARKCAYCDFASASTDAGDPLMARYAAALLEQLSEAEGLGLLEGLRTAYIGGGTPTMLGADALGCLAGAVGAFSLAEFSCEANPDSLTDEVLGALSGAGATRVSIGVQSLDDRELSALGRIHDAARAKERVRAAVASGLDVSCDLMCATPKQTDATWGATLDAFLGLGATHVSVYPLMIEEGTPFDKLYGEGNCPWNSDEAQAARMLKAQVKLEGKGFNRYEVASYAFGNKRCEHNVAYWTGQPYLGLGYGASSMLTLKGYLRLTRGILSLPAPPSDAARARLTVRSDARAIAADPRLRSLGFDIEFLTESQAAAEDLMLGARLSDGLAPGLLAHAREVLGASAVDSCVCGLIGRGLLAERGGRVVPTQEGWLLGNEVYGELWGLAPGEVASASC